MFKKVLLVALSSAYLFGSDFWQVDFHQGTSIYNIENAKKEKSVSSVGFFVFQSRSNQTDTSLFIELKKFKLK